MVVPALSGLLPCFLGAAGVVLGRTGAQCELQCARVVGLRHRAGCLPDSAVTGVPVHGHEGGGRASAGKVPSPSSRRHAGMGPGLCPLTPEWSRALDYPARALPSGPGEGWLLPSVPGSLSGSRLPAYWGCGPAGSAVPGGLQARPTGCRRPASARHEYSLRSKQETWVVVWRPPGHGRAPSPWSPHPWFKCKEALCAAQAWLL